MDKRIQILDCTLRDGGRCFDNTWGDETIKDISKGLSKANIDIIEIGFLWYLSNGICRENTTLFREIKEIEPFVEDNQKYVAYIEYCVFKRENHIIPPNNGTIDGIRLGLLKNEIDESVELMKEIKSKGYNLFVQGINTMSYSEEELIQFINVINEIKPYAFSIVDTYGSMYIEDLKNVYSIVDKYLDKDIVVAFHSHNNKQLAFALAMTLIEISGDRKLIIDATLGGIGMGAGNLNTEFIANYLNEKNNGLYSIKELVNLLDKYISALKRKIDWESSLLTYEAADNWTSQLNLSYIKNEYKDSTRQMQRSILGICPIAKGVSHYKIDEIYRIVSKEIEKTIDSLEELKEKFYKKDIILVGKGSSIIENKERIQNLITEKEPIIIYVNHRDGIYETSKENEYFWYMDKERCNEHISKYGEKNVITFSEISDKAEYIFNYSDIVNGEIISGDSTIILLGMLSNMKNINKVYIVGMDGTNANEVCIKRTNKMLREINEMMDFDFFTNSTYFD